MVIKRRRRNFAASKIATFEIQNARNNYVMEGKSLPDSLAFSLTFEGISLKFRNPPGSPRPNFFLPDSPGSPEK